MITRKNKHEWVVECSLTKDGVEARKWCTNTYGPGGRNKKCRWRYGWLKDHVDTYYFRNERDALFFALKWV